MVWSVGYDVIWALDRLLTRSPRKNEA